MEEIPAEAEAAAPGLLSFNIGVKIVLPVLTEISMFESFVSAVEHQDIPLVSAPIHRLEDTPGDS